MLEWLLIQDGFFIYLALAFLLLLSVIGLPPEEPVIFLGGVIVHRGSAAGGNVNGQHVDGVIIFLVCYLAILIGDLIIYSVGRKIGPALFQKSWFRKRVSPSRISRVRLNLEKRSLVMIFLARHLIYLRTLTFLACGAVRMRFVKFMIADAAAALLSVALLMGLGFLASENYEAVLQFVHKVKYTLGTLVLVGIGIYIWHLRRKRAQQAKL